MDQHNNVPDNEILNSHLASAISLAIKSNHGDDLLSVTCATNTQHKPIDIVWTLSGTIVLKYKFHPLH